MALQSLIAEITGAIPISGSAHDVAPGKRLLVVFEDDRGSLRTWQNDLLWIDRDQLRLLNVFVASLPNEDGEVLVNGNRVSLAVDRLRSELQSTGDHRSGVVLLSSDGRTLLRSDDRVTIQQIGDAIKTTDRMNGWA